MGGRPPTPPRRRRALSVAGLTLALAAGACRGGPTLHEAQALLRSGDPVAALDVARRASARGAPEERIALRRLALQAALAAGLPREAAREYQLLRRLTGRDDDGLLAELAGAVLRRAVTGDDVARQVRGAEALSLLGDDPRAVALLHTALTDRRDDVRAAALATSASLPDVAAGLQQLAAAARDDASPWVRRRALEHLCEALSARELPSAARAELALRVAPAALDDPDEEVRVAAVALLGRAAPMADALLGLGREVGRGSDAVRCAAALELLRLDPPAAARAWAASHLPIAADEPTGALGLALQAHAQEPAEGTIEALRAALRAPAYRVRIMAARGLQGPGAAHLTAALRALALEEPVQPVRAAALDALVAGAPDEARSACRRALHHDDPATRQRAFEGLARLGALGPRDLVALLQDPALADAAARRLASDAGEPGFQALVAGLGHPVAADAALEALAEQGDRRMRRRFADLLTTPDRAQPRALRAAARGLARCGAPADRALLLAMLERPGGHTDLSAAAALLALQTRIARALPTSTAE